MRNILIALGVCVAVTVGSLSVAWADFEVGVAAYQRGDYATAVKEFRAVAEQGAPDAQYNLGFMYEDGKGVVQDYKEAIKWYRTAAEQGHAKAQFKLGVMYGYGRGVIQDYVQAHTWFNIGAANGYEEARKNRDIVEEVMTATDISRAKKLAQEWMEKHQK